MGGDSPDDTLQAFLLDSFSRDELQMLASLIGRRGFVGDIAWDSPLQDIVAQLTYALQRYGLINGELFDVLAKLRPRRVDRLQRLRRENTGENARRHVAVVHASRDSAPIDRLVTSVRQRGHRTWIDTEDATLGELWLEEFERGLRDASVLVVVVTRESVWSTAATKKLTLALSLARHDGIPILPVLLGNVDPDNTPPAVSQIVGLRVVDDIAPLLDALGELTSRGHSRAERRASPILDLALQFFDAVGRDVQPIEPSVLRIPEPVVLAATIPATTFDIAALEAVVTEGEVAYFLYDGPLPDLVSQRFDGMRIRGNPVITVTADTIRAAVQDGNALAVFSEHTRLGTTGVNLFEATNAIANPHLFFGRTELLNQVGGALGRGDAVLVTGVRKAGKSSFLHMLRQQFSTRPTAWIDLQRLSRTDPLWPDRVFARILEAWDRWGRETLSGGWPFTHHTTKTRKPAFVDGMEARAEHHRKLGHAADVLVVLDELERMIPAEGSLEQAECFEEFTGALRSLAQPADRCVTVLAADLRPEANRRNLLPNRHTNPWFSFFVEVPLPPLTCTEVNEMVRSLAARMGVTSVDEEFVAALHTVTGGHAYLTRLISAAAWTARTNPRDLRRPDLDHGLRRLELEATLQRFYEENLWAPLTIAERRALLTMLPRESAVARPRDDARDANAIAALHAQGLVNQDGIAILGLGTWLANLPASELSALQDRTP